MLLNEKMAAAIAPPAIVVGSAKLDIRPLRLAILLRAYQLEVHSVSYAKSPGREEGPDQG